MSCCDHKENRINNFLLWLLDGSCRGVLYYFFIQLLESPLFLKFGGGSIFISTLFALCSSLITLLIAKKTKRNIFWGYLLSLVIFITIIIFNRYLPIDLFPNHNEPSAQAGLLAFFALLMYFITMFLLRIYFCTLPKSIRKNR